ncbi:MAG: M48 family peptidase [Betaproteobacteria bacterium]|nr:MAG: M48 family peptidase [Betaproteobacteria bacterium]
MSFEVFTVVVLFAAVAQYVVETYLLRRHLGHVAAHRSAVPAPFTDSIALADHQRAADYTAARGQLGLFESTLGVFVSLAILFWGLAALWQFTAQLSDAIWLRELLLVVLLSIVTGIIGLPFSYYGTFGIEERFGFNKTTQKTFWLDMVKGALLGGAIMLPLLALLFWLMRGAGSLWWLYAWLVFIGFQLLMLALYPTFIAPLFNKFKPLDKDDTKAAIEALMNRTQFQSNGLFVMDGSTRSSHGNAYFTGFGKAKRIVFFDTLLERLNNNEIVAVLAHELGHFKRKHIVQRLVMMAVFSLAFFAAAAWAMKQPWLFTAFGFAPDTGTSAPGVALILFAMVLPALLFWIGPLSSALSRKHEFEADAYAAEVSSKTDLIAALTKLYRDNASTLTPDPLYSAYHHSHPPAMIRIAHLQGL